MSTNTKRYTHRKGEPGKGSRRVRDDRLRYNSNSVRVINIGTNISLKLKNDKIDIVQNTFSIHFGYVTVSNLNSFVAKAILENAFRTYKLLVSKPSEIKLTPEKFCYDFKKTELYKIFYQNAFIPQKLTLSISREDDFDEFFNALNNVIEEIKALLKKSISDLNSEQQELSLKLVKGFEQYQENIKENKLIPQTLLLLTRQKSNGISPE